MFPRARPLPVADPRVRHEPPQALPTRAFLGRHGGHRRLPPGLYLAVPSLSSATAQAAAGTTNRQRLLDWDAE